MSEGALKNEARCFGRGGEWVEGVRIFSCLDDDGGSITNEAITEALNTFNVITYYIV